MSIEFFGKVDYNKHGNVGSEIPAWALERHIEMFEESLHEKKNRIRLGVVPSDGVPQLREEIRRDEEKLEALKSSKPKLRPKDKDRVASQYKELKEKISEAMHTRTEEERGFVNLHEEARRMVNPCVDVDPELAQACNVKCDKGKVSRNGATRMYQILGKYLGEDTNAEKLRRD